MDLELVAGAVARAVRGPELSLFSGRSRHIPGDRQLPLAISPSPLKARGAVSRV